LGSNLYPCDRSWFPSLADYFQELQDSFSLKWDVEYDSCIEDSLYGHFPLDDSGAIISLLRALRKGDGVTYEKGCQAKC
jgi:hypothetical protein